MSPGPGKENQYTAVQFAKIVEAFPEETSFSDRLGEEIAQREKTKGDYPEERKSIKQGMIDWLKEYDSPGYYKREAYGGKSAKFMYNHLQSPAALIFLAEAAGVEMEKVRVAFEKAIDPGCKTKASQCGVIRKIIPWALVERAIDWRRAPEEKTGAAGDGDLCAEGGGAGSDAGYVIHGLISL